MAYDDFQDDDPYRQKVMGGLNPNSGIAGPQDPFTASAPAQPTGGYDLEAFRKRWMGSGDVNNASGWLDANRDITQGVTLRGEKAYDPSGRFIADLVGNYSGAPISERSRIFLDGVGSNGKPRMTSSAASKGPAMSDAGGGLKVGGSSGMPKAAAAPNPFLDQIRQMIMGRLGAMQQQPSMDDPALAAQSAAYRTSRERGAQQERAAMAERAAAQGLLQGGASSGAFDADVRSIRENAGQDVAANDAGLMGNEVQARRAEVQNLMNIALQSGDAESARLLQAQLANLDAQLRRQAMAMQDRQFSADLGYRNRALDFQGRQWDDQYGRQMGRDYEDDYRWRVLYGL